MDGFVHSISIHFILIHFISILLFCECDSLFDAFLQFRDECVNSFLLVWGDVSDGKDILHTVWSELHFGCSELSHYAVTHRKELLHNKRLYHKRV